VRTIAEFVDRMLVLFPFEVPFYAAHGVDVVHVGHPLVEEVPVLQQAWDRLRRGAYPERYRIALLPGSRRSEVEALLPTLLAAARGIADELPIDVVLVRAPTVDPEWLRRQVRGSGLSVEIAADRRFETVADAHLALCASGTATLETGLIGTPMLVCYRLSPLTYALARWLVRVPHVSLVNLVLGRRVVPELLQAAARPERIAREAIDLLDSRSDVDRMRTELGDLRERLGSPGASARAAAEVARVLDRRRAA
jgi:lipid-A-disaccharide synthase